jgi:hypothetical protein
MWQEWKSFPFGREFRQRQICENRENLSMSSTLSLFLSFSFSLIPEILAQPTENNPSFAFLHQLCRFFILLVSLSTDHYFVWIIKSHSHTNKNPFPFSHFFRRFLATGFPVFWCLSFLVWLHFLVFVSWFPCISISRRQKKKSDLLTADWFNRVTKVTISLQTNQSISCQTLSLL